MTKRIDIMRILAGLNISENEFARSFFTATGDLTSKAIELEASGLPRAAIALALVGIAEKWAASGPHAVGMEELVLAIAGRFPSGSPMLADLQTEYENAIEVRTAAQGLPRHLEKGKRGDG